MAYTDLVKTQRACFESGRMRPERARRERLQRLKRLLAEAESDLLAALHDDLGKPPIEAYTSEIGFVASDIEHAVRNLSRWMRPCRVPTPPVTWPARARVLPEPLGVTLIIGPWNYPVQLLLSPLVAALAAGNSVCLKPSEHAPRTAAVLAEHIARAFPEEEIALVCGDADTAAALLRERFDLIFFTGGSRVGRLVMRAAAEQLTPVVLELGGKSPCIVCADARIETAARRILWGKCLNAGQTCISPDYVLVDRRVEDRLIEAMRRTLRRFYPAGAAASPDYGRIVNDAHFARVRAYLSQGEILAGGGHDAETRFIEPTLLGRVSPEAPVMQEEIFGPVLPVLPVDDLEAALAFVNRRPRPLALYGFTESRAARTRVTRATASGGLCFNDTLSHIIGKGLPFGGVGESGMGQYHGKAGFDAFSHRKPIMVRAAWPDPPFRYPPARSSLDTMRKVYGLLVRGG